MDDSSLKDQVAIVTGAGSGIGRSIALALAEAGANVVVAARTETQIEAVAEEAKKSKVEALPIKTDAANENEIEAMVRKTITHFSRIDILFNNAGIPGPTGFITDIKTEDWDQTIAVNLTGMFLCSRAVLPHMITAKRGNIINVSSGSSKRSRDAAFRSQTRSLVYSVSKFGVEAFTLALASQVNEFNINVNALRPGATATRFHASKPEEARAKMRKADDVKKLAVFLAGQGSTGITGESIDAATWEKIYQTRGLF
jgi:3-oxoacyl-[acyl-carrier protein] reductase